MWTWMWLNAWKKSLASKKSWAAGCPPFPSFPQNLVAGLQLTAILLPQSLYSWNCKPTSLNPASSITAFSILVLHTLCLEVHRT